MKRGDEMSENLIEELERTRQEIKRLSAALKAEEIKTAISTEYTVFGLWEYDIASDTLYPRKKLAGIYGDSLAPIVHFHDAIVSRGTVKTDDLPAFRHFCDDMHAGVKETNCEIRVINDNGKMVWIRFEGRTVFDDNGNPVKVIGRTLDITREKSAVSAPDIRRDKLTDTYTPDLFHDLVDEKRSGKNRYNNAALMCVRIDRFQDIVSQQGTEYGDYVQKTVSEILTKLCGSERETLITRLRDGEFLIYIEFTGTSALDDTARQIVSTIRDYIYDGEPITASVGISMIKSGRKIESIYEEAAAALAEAEKSGGACFMHYSLAMSKVFYDGAADVNTDVDVMSISRGAAKLYNLIIRAFCSPKERVAMIKEAFKTAGQCLGAASIIIFYKGENEDFTRSIIYDSRGQVDNDTPGLEIGCSEEGLLAEFGKQNAIRVHSNNEHNKGLRLTNGAVCAECRAIRFKERITEMFAVVFDSRFELSDQNIHMIDILENALSNMSGVYKERINEQIRRRLRTAAISDHRMEGFSIIPGEFIIDDVGDNAAEHYDLHKGELCYKKLHGLDKPCDNCPALQLDSQGTMFAATAYYNEKESRWLDISASVDENIYGEKRYIISYTDITDCLGKIQMTDQLTGLMTFNVFAAEALRLTAAQESDSGLFAAVMNISGFTGINEEKGYETGNAILVTLANIFQKCVGEGELLCRSDNARFVALLKSENRSVFEGRMNILMNSIQNQVYEKFQTHIVLLMGACDLSDEHIGVMSAVDRAITAQKTIYDMPHYNGNMLAFYDGVMRESIKERRFIEENMIDALKNDEFRVFYQAKVNIETGKVVGAEALVRWIRPNGEIISPGKFVPIFEENGFITEMDFSIYRHAVADIARWLRKGIEVPLISMNVSRRHLADDKFCEKFNALVDGIGVPHEYIELEITESLLTENLNKLVEIAEWFKERNYRISIDDFGSGYSSLNLITMLPFDTLKIDGGFFLRNDLTDKNKKVITSVVSLAKSLNLETVSEGVETQGQVDFLKDLGCDMIQGFFYYKPMPGADFEQVIEAQNKKISN